MTIHTEHPFQDPDPDPVRRFRGRIGGAVTLWTSGDSRQRAGLTVSSLMVAAGERGSVLALLDPDSDLADVMSASGAAVVQLLRAPHRMLAEAFAGLAPAPGGAFTQTRFDGTDWGPRLADAGTWAGVRLVDTREVGWSLLVTCEVERLEIGAEEDLLHHHRGRFLVPGG